MCFSMGWIEQLCIWLIMVIAIVAICTGVFFWRVTFRG